MPALRLAPVADPLRRGLLGVLTAAARGAGRQVGGSLVRHQRITRVRLEEVCVRGWCALALHACALVEEVREHEAVQSEDAS